ncbi:MAG: hypothetical protein SFY56_09705 [Bacteroidota bacterium]|nr:hypothetical protein [Bacteroidota bacterium]
MLKRIVLICFSILFLPTINFGQNNLLGAGEDDGTNLNILYRNDAAGKIYADTRGFGILYRRGKHITAKTRSFYEIDFQTLKSPKEIKVKGEAQNNKRFVYGKLNSIALLRGAIGVQNVLFAKADIKAVEVRYSYSLGPVLALAKPYYYQLATATPSGNIGADQPIAKFNESDFTQDSVIGRGKFSDGLAETKIYPGITGKFNLSFEYASYTNLIRAIETGISFDYFPKGLPIMARNPRENFIITFHVGFVFGKKWI